MDIIRILIADDHFLVRKGIKQILQKEYPAAQIEEGTNTEELIQKATSSSWDIIIMDMIMPGRPGLEAIQQIIQRHPKLPVLVLSAYPEDQYGLRVLKAGAFGYITKNAPPEEFAAAVKMMLQGKKYISSSIALKLVESLSNQDDPDKKLHEKLSDREFEVFKMIAAGKSLNEIGLALSLGSTTISTYRARVLQKMNLKTNAECIRYAIENNLL